MDITELKQRLADFTHHQQLAFPQTDVVTLLQQRSDFYDDLLDQLWTQVGLDRQHLALIAVGGLWTARDVSAL